MIYFACYLFIGVLMIFIKSPVKRHIKRETISIKVRLTINDRETSKVKIILLWIIFYSLWLLIYPYILFDELKMEKREKQERLASKSRIRPKLPVSWLRHKISAEEANAKNMVVLDGKNIPFGYCNHYWRAMVIVMKEGDECYEYSSSDASWKHLSGREGMALVRNGKVVYYFQTGMS